MIRFDLFMFVVTCLTKRKHYTVKHVCILTATVWPTWKWWILSVKLAVPLCFLLFSLVFIYLWSWFLYCTFFFLGNLSLAGVSISLLQAYPYVLHHITWQQKSFSLSRFFWLHRSVLGGVSAAAHFFSSCWSFAHERQRKISNHRGAAPRQTSTHIPTAFT